MKRFFCALMALTLCALFASASLAAVEGDHSWNGELISVTVNEKPMFAPADMTEEQRAIALQLTVSDALFADEAKRDALYAQAALADAEGTVYRPGAATSKDEAPQLMYLYAIPKDTDPGALTLMFIAPSSIPAEYVGEWEGRTDALDLTLACTVEADGGGVYTLTQGSYQETADFSLSMEENTFSLDIQEGNALNIAGCEGTFALEGDILNLSVRTTFLNGETFEYSMACERVARTDDGAA